VSRPSPSRPRRWLPVALVAAALLVGSLVRAPGGGALRGPFGLVGGSLWLHAAGYAALALALAVALDAADRPVWRAPLAVLLVATGYGAVIELLQAGVPYRRAQPIDLLANAVGAAVVALGWGLVRRGTAGRGRSRERDERAAADGEPAEPDTE
jgi:VanZ family protein